MAYINSMFAFRPISVLMLSMMLVGCGANDDGGEIRAFDASLPVIRGGQLNEYVRTSKSPVLVEFGVDFNCPRCAQTKSDVVLLRESLEDQVDVVRVDFNANAQTVARLGGSVCPTYVLFSKGEPVIVRSFPISIDLLADEIHREISR